MAEILRTRVIRPSSRKVASTNYRVNVEKVLKNDALRLEITHEHKPFKKVYYFDGIQLIGRNNLTFKVDEHDTHIVIRWSKVKPVREI